MHPGGAPCSEASSEKIFALLVLVLAGRRRAFWTLCSLFADLLKVFFVSYIRLVADKT